MKDKRIFGIAAVLLLLFPIIYILQMLAVTTIFLANLLTFILDDKIILVGKCLSVAALLLLTGHHYNSAGAEEKSYRILDRVLAVFLPLEMIFILAISISSESSGGPSTHIGFASLLNAVIHMATFLFLVLWAYGLWRSRQRLALLFSVCGVVLLFLPTVPANNPEFHAWLESFNRQEGIGVGGLNTAAPTDGDNSEVPNQEIVVDSYIVSSSVGVYNNFLVIVLAYTWLRWARCLRREKECSNTAQVAS